MASLENLPADQRAVLQMVLGRGRTYDQIAATLSIDREAVRRRALDGCDALTPDGIERGPEQPLVTDYLLSQLSEQVAAEVHTYLESADEDREWAREIATRLQRLAPGPLPDVPVAAPLRSDQPAVAREPERASPPLPFAPHAPKHRNRRLLAALGVAATIVVVAAVLLATRGASSNPKPDPTATRTQSSAGTITAGTTTAATSAPQPLAALNLTSPGGDKQMLGVAEVVRENGVVGIAIDAQGVPPNSAHNAYGLWLYNSAKSHEFVGFDPNLVGKNGKLALEGKLPTNAADFRRLLITLETQQHPRTPGEVVLSGPFREN